MLTDEQKKILLKIARQTIENYIKNERISEVRTDDPVFNQNGGAFVTIHSHGQLRGCIGMIEAVKPLYETIIEMAIESATGDPRFMPLNENELKDIDLEISALTPKRKIKSIDEIELGKHGVIVRSGFHSGVFLPQVATETGWSKEEFMRHLCSGKAGLAPDAYKDKSTEIYIFEAEVFGEKDFI
jgi:AmmeMemoRadiSam system protein A